MSELQMKAIINKRIYHDSGDYTHEPCPERPDVEWRYGYCVGLVGGNYDDVICDTWQQAYDVLRLLDRAMYQAFGLGKEDYQSAVRDVLFGHHK